jgi:hypothetical protein
VQSRRAHVDRSDQLISTGDGHTSYYTSPYAHAATDAHLIRPQPSPDRVCDH